MVYSKKKRHVKRNLVAKKASSDSKPGVLHSIRRMWEKQLDSFFGSVLTVLIAAVLVIVLVVIVKELYQLFILHLFAGSTVGVIDSVLTIFLEMKLFQVLLHYLRDHRIEVEVIAEVGIIAIVKEVMFNLTTFSAMHLFGISALLIALGALFFIEKRYGCDQH